MSTAPPSSRPAGTGIAPAPLGAASQSAVIDIAGMNCASCVSHVQKSAKDVPGVQDCQVNLASGRASVRFDPHQTDPKHIADAISRGGYDATAQQPGADKAQAEENIASSIRPTRRKLGSSRGDRHPPCGFRWKPRTG